MAGRVVGSGMSAPNRMAHANVPEALSGLGAYDPYAEWRAAQKQFERHDYLGAVATITRLIEQHDDERDLAAARELLARSYFHSAQLSRAAQAAREVLERDPSNAYMATLLTRALERSSDHEGAAAARRLAVALGSSD